MYISKFPGSTPCQWTDPELWMSERLYGSRAKLAKELCYTCDERLDCLESTMRFEQRENMVQRTTLGGLYWTERAALYLRQSGSSQAAG